MIRTLLLFVALVLGGCATAPNEPEPSRPLWGGLTPGPHRVGFDLSWTEDGSRPGWNGGKRPIQVWRWYPARPGGERMTLLDYGRLSATEAGAPSGWMSDESSVFAIGEDALPAGGREKLAAIIAGAARSAPAARGRYPLIVMGPGWSYESPVNQHLLAEYLASRGYVVVAAPLTGAAQLKAAVTPADFDAQVRDIDFLIDRFKAHPSVDPSRIGLFGFDLGGMSAVAAATGRDDVDAVVGFDTGVIAQSLIDQLLTPRGVRFSELQVPYLHATRPTAENVARRLPPETLAIFENAPAERLLVRVPGMRHADYALPGALEGVYPAFWGPVPENPAPKLQALIQTAGAFFDRHLKDDDTPLSPPPPLTLQSWPAAR
ncbi:MAG TPA: dienelactone hydrolase family protein [Allosphingosinicella sp.]|uniref:dienelactone hydrolase family protein n=1 Tax=Allosphingosinicella sp. TaxID=2823234 RepID=UPI002EDAF5B8